MSRVVLAAADEELALRVKHAADGDVQVLAPGRLPPTRAGCSSSSSTTSCPTCWSSARSRRWRRCSCSPAGSTSSARASAPSWSPSRRRTSGSRRCGPACATCSTPAPAPRTIRVPLERAASAADRAPAGAPAGRRTARYTGRVITVASPKGGVGKTTRRDQHGRRRSAASAPSPPCSSTSTCSSATSLRARAGARVRLARRRRRAGQPGHDGAEDVPLRAPELVYAVCAPTNPAEADRITGEDVGRVLTRSPASSVRRRRHRARARRAALAALDRATETWC